MTRSKKQHHTNRIDRWKGLGVTLSRVSNPDFTVPHALTTMHDDMMTFIHHDGATRDPRISRKGSAFLKLQNEV